MWRSYVTIGMRALVKNKTYAFINIFGLAIGLAACLMLLLYVRYETNYDQWLPNAENVYQFQTYYNDPQTGERNDLQMASYIAGQRLKADFPQIEHMAYIQSGSATVLRNGEALSVEDVGYAHGPTFDVLQLPLLHGDPRTALQNPASVALSETQARRLFGTDNPIGQTLTVMLFGRQVDHRVTAVYRDLPLNSHIGFGMLVRVDPNSYHADQPQFMTQWGWQSGWVYVALRPGTDVSQINQQLPAWEHRNIPDEHLGETVVNQGDYSDYALVPVRDVHLGRAQIGAHRPGNDHQTIITFTIIAFLILGMACVNFTNLATARAGQRAREVALRKVLGASRSQLIVQFLA
jgi:putative ABC transport system permease protein